MNTQGCDILKILFTEGYINQRQLAESSGHSLGMINRSLKMLLKDKYIDEEYNPTDKAKRKLEKEVPKNAVILAAGYGMRMVPINKELPKGLLEINGKALIERIIEQLQAVDIRKIYIVVGFMKERYEYLMDKYDVDLIVNSEYAVKNNIHSMKRVLEYLSNTYIIPCDIWCRLNPFSKYELYSWYMVSDQKDAESQVRVSRKKELVQSEGKTGGISMIGICYLMERDSKRIRERIKELCQNSKYNNKFWEEALYQEKNILIKAKMVSSADVIEINTYEQLREIDHNSNQLKSDVMQLISNVLNVDIQEITGIRTLKKGMTNRSFLFECSSRKYIMRIPGEGTEQLINRAEEASVYETIGDQGICDDNLYINAENGYKITAYYENSRVCDPLNQADVVNCIVKLRNFHNMRLKVKHEFHLFKQIEIYELLWGEETSVYKDYAETKKKVLLLKTYIDSHVAQKVLSHIDAVPDNFLFVKDKEGKEKICLIDWEYAGMHDPHVDIAMFGIYALYNKMQIDKLIEYYFEGKCEKEIRIKIYCYVAACGLLWSNWCEYKQTLGVDFGEYSLRQYRYAKDYYYIVSEELGEEKGKWVIK